MKRNKASPYKIIIEMLTIFDDLRIDKFIEMIDEVYLIGETPGEIRRYVFVAQPNKTK